MWETYDVSDISERRDERESGVLIEIGEGPSRLASGSGGVSEFPLSASKAEDESERGEPVRGSSSSGI